VRRFELLLETIEVSSSPLQISTAYVEHLAIRAELIEGAYDVLRTLHGTCRLAIVTNGLQSVQRRRLEHSVIRDYIAEVIVSEEVGVAKPQPGFSMAPLPNWTFQPKAMS